MQLCQWGDRCSGWFRVGENSGHSLCYWYVEAIPS